MEISKKKKTKASKIDKVIKKKKPIEIKKKKLDKIIKKKVVEINKEKSSEAISPDTEKTKFFKKNNLSSTLLTSYIQGLKEIVNKENKNKKAIFDADELAILLHVTSFKVPKVPTHQMRILLPHSYISPEDDVALIVSDLKRGRRIDYEPTVEHYKEILKNQNCTQIAEIIPFNRLKTEYGPFELKRKLLNSYDRFLVDGKIAGHVASCLGKKFTEKRKLPVSIRMDSKCLKREIDYALRKTSMKIHGFGDTSVVQIGTMKMGVDQIMENLKAVCWKLAKEFPGGWNNVRSLGIKTANSMTIPVFTSLGSKNKVPITVVEPKRPRNYRTVEGEWEIGKKAKVTPEGGVIIEKDSDYEESDGDDSDM